MTTSLYVRMLVSAVPGWVANYELDNRAWSSPIVAWASNGSITWPILGGVSKDGAHRLPGFVGVTFCSDCFKNGLCRDHSFSKKLPPALPQTDPA